MKWVCLLVLILMGQIVSSQQWESIGPDGGFFKDFLVHPQNPNIIYAGSDDGGGVWKSTDQGNSWFLLTEEFVNFTAWDLEMDPNNPDVIYATDLYGRWGVLKTTNGQDFTAISSGLIFNRDKQVSDLAVDPNNSNTLMLATGEENEGTRIGNGVFKSIDAGLTWERTGLQSQAVPACVISNNGLWLAGTSEHGLLQSSDQGLSWTNHQDLTEESTVYSIDQIGEYILVSAGVSGVFLSNDSGITFNNIGMVGQFNFDVHLISTEPLWAISTGFDAPYHFNNNQWNPVSSELVQNQLMIGAGGHGDHVYMGLFSSTQILHSSDAGMSWEVLENNPKATEVSAILEKDGVLYASLQNSYNLTGDANNTSALAISENGGLTWERRPLQAHGLDIEAGFGLNEVYLGTFAQGLFKSTDKFETTTNIRFGNKLIGDFEISSFDNDLILVPEVDLSAVSAVLAVSTTGGDDWLESLFDVFNDVEQIDELTFIAAPQNNGVFLSQDGGQTWSNSPIVLPGVNVMELSVESDRILAGTDAGQLWLIENLSSATPLNVPWASDLPIEVKNIIQRGDTIVVGLNGAERDSTYQLSGGVFLSNNGGGAWTNLSNGLTNNNVFGMKGLSFNSNGDLLAATYGGGVFKYTLSDNSIDQISIKSPWKIVRQQNELVVHFGQFISGEIRILDTYGRLVERQASQGSTFSCFPPMTSGLYIIQVVTEHTSYSQKFFW